MGDSSLLRTQDLGLDIGGATIVTGVFNLPAAIIVLLLFMLVMNGLAIYLRNRFERRW